MKTAALVPAAQQMDFRAYEATPGISVIVQPHEAGYVIVAVSNDCLHLVGMQKEDLIGKKHFEIFPQNLANTNAQGQQQLKASFEYILQHKAPHEIPQLRYDIEVKGSLAERYWKVSNAPLRNDAGEVSYIINSAVDITEQVVAKREAASAKGIERAYNFFMSAPVIIGFVKGDDYVIEMANESLLEVWGRTSEVVGKPMFQAIPELAAQGFKALLDQVRTTGQPFYANEYPINLNRQGKEEVLYFDFVYKPFYEEGADKAVGVISVGHEVTEQVRTRQKFRNVVQQATDPILILKGEDMVLEVANEALFKIWHVDETALGKTFLEILPEMKNQGFLKLLQQVYHTGEPYRGFEEPALFMEADGSSRTVYFNFTYQPYREADGSITGVMVLAKDVTEQVLARQKLDKNREELRRFKFMVENAQDPFYLIRQDGSFAYINRKALDMLGYTEEEMMQMRVMDIDPLYDERMFAEAFALSQNGGARIETCHQSKEGRIYPLEIKLGSFNFKNEAFMFATARDITERKSFETSLQESQRKWQQLANTIPAFVWTADTGGQVNFMNHHWYQFTGLNEDDSLAFGWTQALHPDDVERCLNTWNAARTQEVLYEVEVRFKSKEGHHRWFITRGVPIYNEEGKVNAWYGTSTDIHEQKMLTENLENLVAERTAALKASNASLEEFAYAASHDMKEPIRKIHFFSDRLKERLTLKLEAEDIKLFERMQQASKRMTSLIDDLLDYSQVTKGVAAMEPVDLNGVVHLVLEDLELEIQQKGAAVKLGNLPVVNGNARQFQQLFQNLVGNALKYCKAGTIPEVQVHSRLVSGADLSIALPKESLTHKFHLITVKDNGIGFDAADAERIFNVFTRLHGNAEYKGTGVGLSIVKKVVENHKGHVWASGDRDKGSVFHVLLPAE